jgi:hypothetical protein
MAPTFYRASLFAASLALAVGVAETADAGDVSCRFKAETDRTEIAVVWDGHTGWSGTIDKGDSKEVQIREGPFTVLSKVYNPNLKTKEDVRTQAHTQMCRDQVALSVPLFPDSLK